MNSKTEGFVNWAEFSLRQKEVDIDADLQRALQDIQRIIDDRAQGRRTDACEFTNVVGTLHRAERAAVEAAVARAALVNLRSVIGWESAGK